jgi:hypothetical protein
MATVASQPITITLSYDDGVKVWYVSYTTVPGLHIEAETLTGLCERLGGALEDLLKPE